MHISQQQMLLARPCALTAPLQIKPHSTSTTAATKPQSLLLLLLLLLVLG
jgi:hypothetical protein